MHGSPPESALKLLNWVAGLHLEFSEARAPSRSISTKEKVLWCPSAISSIKVNVDDGLSSTYEWTGIGM